MRSIFFIVALSIFTIKFSFSQDGYLIKGKIKGFHDTICYLGNYYGNNTVLKDTVRVDKEGEFVFKGKKKLDGGIYFIVSQKKQMLFEILVDKEQIFSVETDTSLKRVEHMKVKGSEDNILFYKYKNFIEEEQAKAGPIRKRITTIQKDSVATATTKKDSIKILSDKSAAVDKEVEAYKEKFIKDHPASFLSIIFKAQHDPVVPVTPLLPNGRKDSLFPYLYYKDHYWDNINLSDDRILRTPIFHMRLKNYFDKIVLQHPDSIIKEADILVGKTNDNKEMFKYIIWYITSTYETSPIMGMDAVFVHEVEKYYLTKKAFWVDSINIQKIIHKAMLLKPLLLEKPAPPVTLQDTLDNNISLYEVKAKYTIVIFWDSDCGHCQKIVPKLRDAYDKTLKSKGVAVYAVETEDKEAKWKKFIVDNKLNWINVYDKYKQYFFHDLYDETSTPTIYLLDENKRIKAKRIDVDQLDGYIDHLEKIKEVEKIK